MKGSKSIYFDFVILIYFFLVLEILQACSEQIREHKSLRVIFDGMKDICMGNIKVSRFFSVLFPLPFSFVTNSLIKNQCSGNIRLVRYI